jgi:hypothetical protein
MRAYLFIMFIGYFSLAFGGNGDLSTKYDKKPTVFQPTEDSFQPSFSHSQKKPRLKDESLSSMSYDQQFSVINVRNSHGKGEIVSLTNPIFYQEQDGFILKKALKRYKDIDHLDMEEAWGILKLNNVRFGKALQLLNPILGLLYEDGSNPSPNSWLLWRAKILEAFHYALHAGYTLTKEEISSLDLHVKEESDSKAVYKKYSLRAAINMLCSIAPGLEIAIYAGISDFSFLKEFIETTPEDELKEAVLTAMYSPAENDGFLIRLLFKLCKDNHALSLLKKLFVEPLTFFTVYHMSEERQDISIRIVKSDGTPASLKEAFTFHLLLDLLALSVLDYYEDFLNLFSKELSFLFEEKPLPSFLEEEKVFDVLGNRALNTDKLYQFLTTSHVEKEIKEKGKKPYTRVVKVKGSAQDYSSLRTLFKIGFDPFIYGEKKESYLYFLINSHRQTGRLEALIEKLIETSKIKSHPRCKPTDEEDDTFRDQEEECSQSHLRQAETLAYVNEVQNNNLPIHAILNWLIWASQKSDVKMAYYIKILGQFLKIDGVKIDVGTEIEGLTPLHLAVKARSLDAVMLLLNYAQKNHLEITSLKDKNFKTPLDLACEIKGSSSTSPATQRQISAIIDILKTFTR